MNTLSNHHAREVRDQVSPVELLARLGFQPSYKSGTDLYYLSMLRKERTASFCVNNQLGVWYDHGGSNPSGIISGNVIDLALAYWFPLTLTEVIGKIAEVCQTEKDEIQSARRVNSRPRKATKIPYYRVSEIKELGNNPTIKNYLLTRGIWSVAHELLKEVYYFIEDEKKLRKYFFSAGWSNENGGWELETEHFKGCLGTKGLTIIQADDNRVAVFKDMMDYLSWKFEQCDDGESVIILNTPSLIDGAIKRAAQYDQKTYFFDNDGADASTVEHFQNAYPNSVNGALNYAAFKNYNNSLIAELENLYQVQVSQSPVKL